MRPPALARASRSASRLAAPLLWTSALLLAAGCSPPEPRGVLLISIDTLRADRVGSYGYPRPTTPALDSLAAQGVVFERALAPTSWTLPSHASMLTGLEPARHGVVDWDRSVTPDATTLASRLRSAGFRTAAFVNNGFLNSKNGILRGFDEEFLYPPVDARGRQPTAAIEMIADMKKWLATNGGQDFFLFFHVFDTHSDYRCPPRHRQRFVRPYDGALTGTTEELAEFVHGRRSPTTDDLAFVSDLYDCAIRQLDDRLAVLFDFLEKVDLAETTTVIVTSDHGEAFGEHESLLHGQTIYEEVVHVPLILRGPAVPEGVRIETPVGLIDLSPTVLGLLGLSKPPRLDGRDLAALWRGEVGPVPLYAEVSPHRTSPDGDTHQVSVTLGDEKLILDLRSERAALYDLARDPGETRDLSGERSERAAALRALLDARSPAVQTRADALTDETRTLLRRLGYAE